MVEDNPADAWLFKEAMKTSRVANTIGVAEDGQVALDDLRRVGAARPDLILLDLNLPRLSGHEVLSYVKNDPELRQIPVVIFSSSNSPDDISRAYESHANCYVRKPQTLDDLYRITEAIDQFWFHVASLPARPPVQFAAS